MACHSPPLKKEKKKAKGNAITRPQSHPIPKFWDGNEDGQWHFPLFLLICFLRDGV